MIVVVQDDYGVQVLGKASPKARGTDETVAAIWGVAQVAAKSSEVRGIARRLAGPMDLYHWLAAHVSFNADPKNIELIRTPQSMIRTIRRNGKAVGDCDDRATLGVSLLAAMGHVPALIVSAKQRTGATQFQHIFFGYRIEYMGSRLVPGVGDTFPDPSDKRFRIVPMDPQEGRPPGAHIPEPIRRIYTATGKHAIT